MRELDEIFARLPQSGFRSRFALGKAERLYLQQKGMETVLRHGRDFIQQRLAPAYPAKDGKQTPMRGHPIFIAQHATATCCRSCLAKWHGIPIGRTLGRAETEHVLAALERWLLSQPAANASPAPRAHGETPAGRGAKGEVQDKN